MQRLTPGSALAKLSEVTGRQFMGVLHHGSLEVESTNQTRLIFRSHTKDEIYIVISGSGVFINGEARHPFQAGEVLFVPAGVEHRFENFTEDFVTWVFFYGPEGGEAKNLSLRKL